MINRIKAIILGQFLLYWLTVLVIAFAAPDVFGLPVPYTLLAAAGLALFLALLSIGVIRGWRWLFWLILLAFLAGILRLLTAPLELAGWIPRRGPPWYVMLSAVIGLFQFATAIAMVAGYRRSGVWGDPGRT